MNTDSMLSLDGDQIEKSQLPILPSGWCWTRLEALVENHDGRRRPIKAGDRDKRPGKYPYYGASGVIDDIDDFLFDGEYLLIAEDGANLLSRNTPIAFRASGQFWVNNHAHIVQLRGGIPLAYLELFLNGTNLQFYVTGTAQPKLNQVNLNRIPVPLAPVGEQQRIVAKIEELFSDLDVAVATLQRVKVKLNRYRASVLKAAIEGKLTAEWREQNPTTESASVLLKRILLERRDRWEESQRARFTAADKEPPKNWQAKYQEPSPIDADSLPQLPEGWCWTRIIQVGDIQLGRQRSPEHHYGPHMRPYLRVANVFENRIDTDDVLQMNFNPEEYETFRLRRGDILLNEGQSLHLVGRPAMYRDEVPGACFQNTLVRFRAVAGLVPEYALYVFLAYLHNKRFQKVARWTVNIAHLGADRFSQIEFPLPPVEEQVEIIREIEARLTVVDQVTAQVDANLKRASRLRQGILKRAFEGKLVPQIATDEPASVLLDRIRQQRLIVPQKPNRKLGGVKLGRTILENMGRTIAYCLTRAKIPHGRTWLAKVLSLGELHIGIPFKQSVSKYPHGPFDDMIYKAERVAKKAGWFDFSEQQKAKELTSYSVVAGTHSAAAQAAEFLGEKRPAFDELLHHFDDLNSDEAELFATVYAAWNDLLIHGRQVEDESIIAEFYAWDVSKKKFSRDQILNRIAWMRQHGYVPTGQGQRTTVVEKKTKPPSSRKKQPRTA